MKIKLAVFVTVVIAIGVLIFWAGLQKPADDLQRRGRSASNSVPEMCPDHGVTRLPIVERVTIRTKTIEGEILAEIELVPGVAVTLPGTSIKIRATDFYTHWNYNGHPANVSFHETNPAIKVEVLKSDTVSYYQWAFRNVDFFGLGGGLKGQPGQMRKEVAFTLVSYEGLSLPDLTSEPGDDE